MSEKSDYSGRPLGDPEGPGPRRRKFVPPYTMSFDLPDGRTAAMHGDDTAYVLDEDGAYDFDQPAEVPEFYKGTW